MDSAGSDRPQRRTALVGRELGRYGIEIAALSETRLALAIHSFGVDVKLKRGVKRVGFAIKSDLVGKLT